MGGIKVYSLALARTPQKVICGWWIGVGQNAFLCYALVQSLRLAFTKLNTKSIGFDPHAINLFKVIGCFKKLSPLSVQGD